jgi:hypothetical protein
MRSSMITTGRTTAFVTGVLTLAFSLAGCAGVTPAADAGQPRTPEPSAEATMQDPLGSVAVVVLRPEHLELRDDAGTTVRTLSYDMSAEEISAALTIVFDSPPEIEEYPGSCCESPAATIYHWDEFSVADDHRGRFADDDPSVWIPEDGPDVVGMNVSVTAAVPAVAGVTITTTTGFEVGEDVESLATELGVPYDPAAEYHRIPVEYGPELGPSEEEGMLNAHAVVLLGPGPDGALLLRAPLNLGTHTV